MVEENNQPTPANATLQLVGMCIVLIEGLVTLLALAVVAILAPPGLQTVAIGAFLIITIIADASAILFIGNA